MDLLKSLLQLNENSNKGLGDPATYKVKNIKETEDGKRIQFDGYKKRNGRFVKAGVFTAKAGTSEDKLWKEIDDHFSKFDDGKEDDE
jgi:hypothetical protein